MKQNKLSHFYRNHVRSISEKQKINFFRQLGILTTAGVPILKALKLLHRSQKGQSKKLIGSTIDLIEQGEDFSSIGRYYTSFFDQAVLAMIVAGENSGNLPAIFEQIYETLQKKADFKRKIKGAMIMPVLTFVFAIGVIFFMALYVIPKFSGFLKGMGKDLPKLTQIVLDVSNFIVMYWKEIATYSGSAIAMMIVLYMLLKPLRIAMAYVLIFSPLVGPIALYSALTNFSSIMAKLIKSGVGIVESITIAGKGIRLLPLKIVIDASVQKVIKGGNFSKAFEESKIVPLIFSDLLRAGEESGNMDNALEQIAKIYREEADHKIAALQTAIQPIMTLLIGGLVGIVAASLILGMVAMWAVQGGK